MNKQRTAVWSAVLLCALLLALRLAEGLTAAGAAGGIPSIGWWMFGGGGGPASANGVTLNVSVGQPVVGPASGDSISLGAGYEYGADLMHEVYLPLVMKSTR